MWDKVKAWWQRVTAKDEATSARPFPSRGVPVKLDKERHLRYSLGTMEAIRAEFGEGALSGELTGTKLARVLWHGLKWEDASLTPEQVAEMVDLESLSEVVAALTKAVGSKASRTERVADPTVAGQPSAGPAVE